MSHQTQISKWFLVLLIAVMTPFLSCNGQQTAGEQNSAIKWMKFEDAVKLAKAHPKKMFIDVYTSWCGWCKRMDATTFAEKDVASYINENFYAVKLDAETRDSILFQDKIFRYLPEYKTNEIAISLLGGKMGYPSYVFLDENFSLMSAAVQGFHPANEMMVYLTYFAGNLNQTREFEQYRQEYMAAHPGQ